MIGRINLFNINKEEKIKILLCAVNVTAAHAVTLNEYMHQAIAAEF